MYKSFYSLSDNPFKKEIETKDLYQSENLKELSARLDYLKKTRGIAVIIGEPGSGKTCLLYTSPSPRDRQKPRMPSSA